MRRFTGVVAALAVLAGAPAALAATPDEIYKDLADNGRLDQTYTQAEMQAFLQSASVQGYGNPVVVATPPTVTPAVTPSTVTPAATPAPASGVAGVAKTIGTKAKTNAAAKPAAQVAGAVSPAQAPLQQTARAETLPFTGAELAMFALVGAALLLGGILLRVSSRQR